MCQLVKPLQLLPHRPQPSTIRASTKLTSAQTIRRVCLGHLLAKNIFVNVCGVLRAPIVKKTNAHVNHIATSASTTQHAINSSVHTIAHACQALRDFIASTTLTIVRQMLVKTAVNAKT